MSPGLFLEFIDLSRTNGMPKQPRVGQRLNVCEAERKWNTHICDPFWYHTGVLSPRGMFINKVESLKGHADDTGRLYLFFIDVLCYFPNYYRLACFFSRVFHVTSHNVSIISLCQNRT